MFDVYDNIRCTYIESNLLSIRHTYRCTYI